MPRGFRRLRGSLTAAQRTPSAPGKRAGALRTAGRPKKPLTVATDGRTGAPTADDSHHGAGGGGGEGRLARGHSNRSRWVGMLTPGRAGPVIHARSVRAHVPSRVLDGLESDAHVQQRRDEGVAEAVGVDANDLVVTPADQPGGLGEFTEHAVDRLAVEGARAAPGYPRGHAWRRKIGPCDRTPTGRSTARSVRSLRATSTSLPPLPRTTSE